MDSLITIDDVIRAGACPDGAYSVANRLYDEGVVVAAAMRVQDLERELTRAEKPHARRAAALDGYSKGFGRDDGYGYGDGYGGDGYGYGDGYGGDGYGYGYGYGDGDGYGGDGYGYGYGGDVS